MCFPRFDAQKAKSQSETAGHRFDPPMTRHLFLLPMSARAFRISLGMAFAIESWNFNGHSPKQVRAEIEGTQLARSRTKFSAS